MADEEVWKPHLTVAAVCQRGDKFLMVRERVNGEEVINQPAGHLEPGESIVQAVIREILEETAYEFVPERFCGVYRYIPQAGVQQTIVRLSISGRAGDRLERELDQEILAAEWITLEQLQKSRSTHRSPMVLQCVLDYLQQPTYPLDVFNASFQ